MAACSPHATQPTVVLRPADACSGAIAPQDPYEAALARARCEHPEMLVHPRRYLVRRVPSGADVARFALEDTERHVTVGFYEIRRAR